MEDQHQMVVAVAYRAWEVEVEVEEGPYPVKVEEEVFPFLEEGEVAGCLTDQVRVAAEGCLALVEVEECWPQEVVVAEVL